MGYIQRWFGLGRDDDKVKDTSPFDVIRHEDMRGEFWLARELAPKLGYSSGWDSWRNFSAVVDKAVETLKGVGNNPADHVVGVNGMVEIGSGAQREVADFRLSRLACYLVAMSGDSRKPEVAAAKTYFAIKTREAELIQGNPKLDRKVKTWLEAGKELDWIWERLKGQIARGVWTDTCKSAGVKGWGYSHLTRTVTKKLTGKYPVEIREERGVHKTRDGFTIHDHIIMGFAEHLSSQMIEKDGAQSYRDCKSACEVASENTMRAINDSLRGKSIS